MVKENYNTNKNKIQNVWTLCIYFKLNSDLKIYSFTITLKPLQIILPYFTIITKPNLNTLKQ